jgi:hypothetical protein
MWANNGLMQRAEVTATTQFPFAPDQDRLPPNRTRERDQPRPHAWTLPTSTATPGKSQAEQFRSDLAPTAVIPSYCDSASMSGEPNLQKTAVQAEHNNRSAPI